MSSTFYIDTNRQNSSVKSKDNNSEWEYRLSNNLQLPAGTEVCKYILNQHVVCEYMLPSYIFSYMIIIKLI